MLHRAFARLGAMGLNCTCVDQSEDVTRRRAEAGECYVAVCGGRVIGTATLYATDPSSACSLYRREGVASVRQVAVDPDCQSRGIGALLLAFAEQWARALYAARTRYAAPRFAPACVLRCTGFRRRRRDALRRQALRQRDPLQAACRPPCAPRVAGVAHGRARGGRAASCVCVAVAHGRRCPARPARAPWRRLGGTTRGRCRELPLVAVASASARALYVRLSAARRFVFQLCRVSVG